MSTSKLSELQQSLLRELGDCLAPHRFVPVKNSQSFYRNRGECIEAVHISFIRHAHDFDVTVSIALRIESVEALVNQFETRLTNAEKKRTFTLGAELGNIARGEQMRWTVMSPGSAESAARSIGNAVEVFGLPYLAQFAGLDQVLALLERNDNSSWLSAPIHGSRCKRAIALAHVLGRAADATRIADASIEFLSLRGDPGLESVRQFVAALAA